MGCTQLAHAVGGRQRHAVKIPRSLGSSQVERARVLRPKSERASAARFRRFWLILDGVVEVSEVTEIIVSVTA